MKAKFWLFIQNNGDGSVSPIFFRTKEEAEKYEEFEEEYCDGGWGESSINFYDLEIDEEGVLLKSEPQHDPEDWI